MKKKNRRTKDEFKEWLKNQDADVQQFGKWLAHHLFPKRFEQEPHELFDALESTINGAVSFVDGLGLAEQNGVTDRRLLWVAAYLGARFGRIGLPETIVTCLETCRPSVLENNDQVYLTRPDILVERVLARGALHG